MPDIWLGRFSRWVEKVFNIKGGPALVDLSPSVTTFLPLDKGVDQRYLEGWNRFAVVANVAAVAAQNGRVRIRNPVASNVVAVVEQLTVTTVSAVDFPIVTWGSVTTDLATLVALGFTRIDPRGNPTPTSIVSFNQQASGGSPFLQKGLAPVGTAVDFINNVNQELTNLPGQAIDIQANAVNNQMIVTLMWRERALESSELN